jgi:hypothetical protein
MKLADCSVREARRFGVTLEIGGSDDYPLGRRWAAAFDGAGFQGIRYRLRHDPSGNLHGVALFGDAGEGAWPVELSEIIPDNLIREAEERICVVVVPGLIR